MIQINLLPEELRKPESTSGAGLVLMVVADLLLVGAGMAAFLWLRLVLLPTQKDKLEAVQQRVGRMADETAHLEALGLTREALQSRRRGFERLAAERVRWSTRLSALSSAIGGQPVWLEQLETLPPREQDGQPVPRMSTKVWVAGTDERRATAFRESLREHPVYGADLDALRDAGLLIGERSFSRKVGGRTVQFREDKHYTFTLEQTFKPRRAGRTP